MRIIAFLWAMLAFLPSLSLAAESETGSEPPFITLEQVVDETHPHWDRYKASLARFPTLESCTLSPVNPEEDNALPKMNWHAAKNLLDLDVCLFRIAQVLDIPEELEAWLENQDFKVSGINPNAWNYRLQNPGTNPSPNRTLAYISAFWTKDQLREFTSIYREFNVAQKAIFNFSKKLGFQFNIGEDYRVVAVSVSVNSF